MRWRELERDLQEAQRTIYLLNENLQMEIRQHKRERATAWRLLDEKTELREKLNQYVGFRPPQYQGVKARFVGELLELFPRGVALLPSGEVGEITATPWAAPSLRPYISVTVRLVDKEELDVDNTTLVGVVREGRKILATKIDVRR